MSGCGFSRINFPESDEDESLRNDINAVFDILNTDDHQFGLLYNALVENTFGPPLKRNFNDHLSNIYADSGGLQIVTLGKKVTEEIKQKVYHNQGSNSTIGFSFDVIPVKVQGERSSRLDTTNRSFDAANFEDMAIQTGKNVWEQIQTFDRMGSDTKPIIIMHGNCYDTYMRWCELLLEQIPRAHHSRIGGVAMGGAALGFGTLEDVRRAFYFTQLPIDIERQHLHLLGVGSVVRMLPIAALKYSGLYEGVHVSYDSTSHSSGPVMGKYYGNKKPIKIRKGYLQDYDVIKKDIMHLFPGLVPDLPLQEFHDAVNMNSTRFAEIYGSRHDFIKIQLILIAGGVYNFKTHLDTMFRNKAEVINVALRKNIASEINSLMNVKSKTDFDQWEREVTRSNKISSTPIQSTPVVSLDSLFA